MSYIKDICKGKSKEYIYGFIAGITSFAWWKEGKQEVGTTGTLLKDAIKDVLSCLTPEEKETIQLTKDQLKAVLATVRAVIATIPEDSNVLQQLPLLEAEQKLAIAWEKTEPNKFKS